MKKTIILFLILLIFSFLIKQPKYIELNNLHIIDKITIYCDKTIYREIIPNKDNNGLKYNYKYHNKLNKNYYTKKAKVINKCIKKDSK